MDKIISVTTRKVSVLSINKKLVFAEGIELNKYEKVVVFLSVYSFELLFQQILFHNIYMNNPLPEKRVQTKR